MASEKIIKAVEQIDAIQLDACIDYDFLGLTYAERQELSEYIEELNSKCTEWENITYI